MKNRHTRVENLHAPRQLLGPKAAPLHLARKPAMRPYLSYPRGSRIPSPRILFYASDVPGLARRDLHLGVALLQGLWKGTVVLATGADELTATPLPQGVEVVKVPALTADHPEKPLARERIRRMRQRLLSTLFDVFVPDLLVLDMVGGEAAAESRLLLQRARALGIATLVGVSHDEPGVPCFDAADERAGEACERCRQRLVDSAREALRALQRRRER